MDAYLDLPNVLAQGTSAGRIGRVKGVSGHTFNILSKRCIRSTYAPYIQKGGGGKETMNAMNE